jgi:hypothetical protein
MPGSAEDVAYSFPRRCCIMSTTSSGEVTCQRAKVFFELGPTAVEKMPSGVTSTLTSGRASISSGVHVEVMAIGAGMVSTAGTCRRARNMSSSV